MYYMLRQNRRKRGKQRSNRRYYIKHPSHKMKYGHRFQRNQAYAREFHVCKISGRDR